MGNLPVSSSHPSDALSGASGVAVPATAAVAGAIAGSAQPRVALIKSLATHNRFYALASPDCGIVNAGVVEEVPHDLLLGIAYPCLEDGLNDFCIIRTAFETLDLFPDDDETRSELREMIADARSNLTRRLMELLERIIARKAHFLGTDLHKLKNWTVQLIEKGISRYDIDAAMKVNVFSAVALAEQAQGQSASPRYRYEFHNSETAERISSVEGREFLVALLADVLDSVLEDDNYQSRYTFDKHIFQQFIAMMFVAYSSTDPVFYGTHKEDYGICTDKDMEKTPLYSAVKNQLQQLSGLLPGALPSTREPSGVFSVEDNWDAIALAEISAREQSGVDGCGAPLPLHTSQVQIAGANEETLLAPISAICAVAHLLQKREPNSELALLLLREASRLVQELKMMGVLSPLALNPGAVDDVDS